MSQFDSNKDYYGVLGVDKDASQVDIDRQYKRQAAKHHPDRGGNEERMKSLNEAYGVLKDTDVAQFLRCQAPAAALTPQGFAPVTTPTARDVGALGHVSERVALFVCGYVSCCCWFGFSGSGFSGRSLFWRSCARVWSVAGAECDGGGECVAAGDEPVEASYATSGSRFLGGDC